MSIERHYTGCRFGQLHYLTARPETGAATRPPLVLLHQNPSSSVEYRFLIEAMATDRMVFAFDTPGYGMSDRPSGPQTIAGYAGAFADAMDRLELGVERPVDLYGFHTGTYLAVELALARPERVGRLVLTGIPFHPVAEREKRLAQAKAIAPPDEAGSAILERLRWLWDFTVTQRHPGVPIERAADMFAERAKPLHRYGWAYEGVWSYDLEARFPLLRHRTLLLQPHEPILQQSLAGAGLLPDMIVRELPTLDRDVFEPEAGLDLIVQGLRDFLA